MRGLEGYFVSDAISVQIPASADIDIRAEVPKYVSRAGIKLEKALDHFSIAVEGLVCLDSGLSTGGFTDCLLQRGAAQVCLHPELDLAVIAHKHCTVKHCIRTNL